MLDRAGLISRKDDVALFENLAAICANASSEYTVRIRLSRRRRGRVPPGGVVAKLVDPA